MSTRKPNIILIMADQLKATAVGCYGNDVVPTPHIDRMAEGGLVFDQCHVQNPACVPSRCCFLTGRYVHAHKVWANRYALPDHEVHLGHVFQEAGYHTALVGSNHVLPNPRANGFETFAYHEWPWPELPRPDRKCGLRRDAGPSPYSLAESSAHQIGQTMGGLIDRLDDRPLFAWVSFFDPHPPYCPPKPYDSLVDPGDVVLPASWRDDGGDKPPSVRANRDARAVLTEDDWRRVMACYYGQIALVDDQVGRIVEALERTGRLADTLLVFTSDHGDFMAEHGCVGKPQTFFDCLTRVPMVLRGPGIGPARCPALAETIDLAPALCRYAGIDPPPMVQGRDLLAVARGDAEPRDAVFCEGLASEKIASCGGVSGVMVRTGTHKLCLHTDGFVGLHDLRTDPGERRNLARATDAAIVAARRDLEQRLLRWFLQSRDLHPWHAVPDLPHAQWAAMMNAGPT